MNRRSFLGTLLTGLGVLASGLFTKAFAERKRGGGGEAKADAVTMLDPNSPPAKAVNFAVNKTDVKDAKLKTERQSVTFDKQNCANCGFYSNPKDNKGTKVGNCQIFPNMFVKAESWCTSWNKKA